MKKHLILTLFAAMMIVALTGCGCLTCPLTKLWTALPRLREEIRWMK